MGLNAVIGMSLVTCGQICFATLMALEKYYDVDIESEFLFFRYFVQLVLATIGWNGCKRKIFKNADDIPWYGETEHQSNIWIRGFLHFTNMFCYWYGLQNIALSDASAIFFTSPIIIAFIAKFYLKEELAKIYYVSAILGIISVVFISQPNFLFSNDDSINLTSLLCIIIATLAWSFCAILIRTVVEVHYLQIEMVSSGVSVFICIPLVLILNYFLFKNNFIGQIYNWQFENVTEMIVMLSCGLLGFAGMIYRYIL